MSKKFWVYAILLSFSEKFRDIFSAELTADSSANVILLHWQWSLLIDSDKLTLGWYSRTFEQCNHCSNRIAEANFLSFAFES